MTAGRNRASREDLRKAAQAEAYQTRLRNVRGRLQARLQAKAAALKPDGQAPPVSDPMATMAAPAPQVRIHPAGPRVQAPKASPIGMFRFIFLALALWSLFPTVGAEIFQPVPPQPGIDPPPHAEFVAGQTARFNQTLARTLGRLPGPGAAPAAGPGPAPKATLAEVADLVREVPATGAGTVATLNARLALFRQLTARDLADVRKAAGSAAPFPPEFDAQLAGLDTLATGMQIVAAGYQARILDPAGAIGLIDLASDTLLNIVNSFRVASQLQALSIYGPGFERLGAQMNETRARIASGRARADLEVAIPFASPSPADSATLAQRGKACCEYLDLVAQIGVRQVIGAAGAINAAAYLAATEAAAEIAGLDLAAALPAPARDLLAATDLGAATAAALGATVLAPPPGAAAAPDAAVPGNATGLTPRCEVFRCGNPITQAQAQVAGATLAGSIMNLVGYVLYSTSVQLSIAMQAHGGSAASAPPAALDPDRPSPWLDGLMRRFRDQALATVPAARIAALLDTVPGAQATGASAFSGIVPGSTDAELFQSVAGVIAKAVQEDHLPALAAAGTSPAAVLSGLYRLAATGQELRGLGAGGTRTARSEAQWQYLSNLAAYSRYALATTNGCRMGIIDSATATTLLKDIADTLQALVYGMLAETSAVPLEASLLYQQGAAPQLAKLRAGALGLDPPSTARTRTCQDCCHEADLQNLWTAQEISRQGTRTYLAAYSEALTGSSITETLDIVAAARRAAPTRNGTQPRITVQGAAAQEAAAPAGTAGPAPAAAEPAPAPGQPPAACASCACDLSFSRQQIGLAQEILAGSELTQFAYTLNLVVKAFRIALAAEPGR